MRVNSCQNCVGKLSERMGQIAADDHLCHDNDVSHLTPTVSMCFLYSKTVEFNHHTIENATTF